MAQSIASIRQIPDRVAQFRELASLYAEYCREEGLRVVPFHSPDLPHFSRNSPERQEEAIRHLVIYLEVFEEMRAQKYSLRDSPKLLWRCLNRLGLTPQSDVFDKIGDGNVVEIYSTDQRQLFHNIKFWEYISFSIEQVFGTEWWVMSRRSEDVSRQIYELGVKLVTGEIAGTFMPNVPVHVVEEHGSPEANRFTVNIHHLSPVKANGQVAGVLVINTCCLI